MEARVEKPHRIAGYCRISVDVEADRDNTSIENQKDIISDYVQRYFTDSELTFFVDRDRSGYTFEQREDYQRMRPYLMTGQYDILIIKDLSRFSRRNSRGLVELEDLRDAGVRIVAIGDSIDYPTHDDWTNIRLRFLLNEMPVTDSSQKVKSVISRRQQDGRWICSVPYGYVMKNHKLMTYEIDPAAAEVVRKIFELYTSGWGYKRIANYLTDHSIPTPRRAEAARKAERGEPVVRQGKDAWAIVTIQGMLSNDFYIGTLRQGKYRRKGINGRDERIDESKQLVFENHHEPIIDYPTFAYVQEQMKKRTRSNYNGIRKYETPYTGLLFCGDCGSPMFSMSSKQLDPAYTCGTYHRRGRKGCTSHHTRVDFLDSILKMYVQKVKQGSANMIDALEASIRDEKAKINEGEKTQDMLRRQIDAAKNMIAGLETDIQTLAAHPHPEDGFAGMEVKGDNLTDKDNAGAALLEACKEVKDLEPVPVGSYRGFQMALTLENFGRDYFLTLKGQMSHRVELGRDARGNLVRIDNALNAMPERVTSQKAYLDNLYAQVKEAKAALGKPFPQEEELRVKSARLAELNAELNIDDKTPMERLAGDSDAVAKSTRPSILQKLRAPLPEQSSPKPKHKEMEVQL